MCLQRSLTSIDECVLTVKTQYGEWYVEFFDFRESFSLALLNL